MNGCNQYEEAISGYVDHELDRRETAAMFTHLATCAACQDFLSITLRIHATLGTDPELPVPLELDRRVSMQHSHAGARDVGPSRRLAELWRRKFFIPVPAAACAALMLITVITLAALLWFGDLRGEMRPRVVHTISLSTIEVQGVYPQTPKVSR